MSIITRLRFAWGKFLDLLPLLTSSALSFTTQGQIYISYVRGILLYASECWAPTRMDFMKLQRNDRAMIRWICNARLDDRVSSDSLLRKLRIASLETTRLRWFGHVERSKSGIKQCTELEVEGRQVRGRPRKTCNETINNDKKEWKLNDIDLTSRVEWRKALRTKMGKLQPALSGNVKRMMMMMILFGIILLCTDL